MIVAIIIGLLIVFVIGAGALFGAPFVPTRKIWIADALKLADISRNDTVVDLGSGDGAVLKCALECGAKKAIGYEINPLLALVSRIRLRKFRERAIVKTRDFFHEDLPADTTVIYLFGVGRIMPKIARYLAKQRPKLTSRTVKVVTFGFAIPDMKMVHERKGMKLYEF